jgi:hypothetical protein
MQGIDHAFPIAGIYGRRLLQLKSRGGEGSS